MPLISIVIGEGGSGGAVAFATANKLAMLEHSVYSVISPEGCAAILWKDPTKVEEAAEALRLTSGDLKKLKVADVVIEEPNGGAQRNKDAAIDNVSNALAKMLGDLKGKSRKALVRERRKKYLEVGSKGLSR